MFTPHGYHHHAPGPIEPHLTHPTAALISHSNQRCPSGPVEMHAAGGAEASLVGVGGGGGVPGAGRGEVVVDFRRAATTFSLKRGPRSSTLMALHGRSLCRFRGWYGVIPFLFTVVLFVACPGC